MNIQIFMKSKCFDSKKAERYFKERGIKFQSIDLVSKGLSKGEFNSVSQSLGGWKNLVDEKSKDKDTLALVQYLSEEDAIEKLMENPKLFKSPIVRNGKKATIGYMPEIWKTWD